MVFLDEFCRSEGKDCTHPQCVLPDTDQITDQKQNGYDEKEEKELCTFA